MNFLHVIILGIVEGLTEFLPVSSTGHLILVSQLLGIAQTEFVKSFQIVIQFGAILAVAVLYTERIIKSKHLWKKVVVGFVPTALVGYVLYKIIKTVLIGNGVVVAISLIIGGAAIIVFEKWYGSRQRFGKPLEDISYREALVVGLVQSLAVIPGVSRSAATILGGLAQNISRAAIVEFSFLLAVPVIAGAALLDLIKTPIAFSGGEWGLLALGSLVSFITALLAIRFFIQYVQQKTFVVFGYYRIIVGCIALAALLLV